VQSSVDAMIYDRVSILDQSREQLTAGLFISDAPPSEQKVLNIVLPEIDTTQQALDNIA
jgi:hypothetical protein